MSELAYVRAVSQQTQACGACALPPINPFHPWSEHAVFRGKDGERRVVEISDVVAALGAKGTASEAAHKCIVNVHAQGDVRLAIANIELTAGTETCPPLCVKLVALRSQGQGVDLIVPAMFVAKLLSANAQWLTGLMDEEVDDFERSKSFGTMWRLSDVTDDAAVLGMRRGLCLRTCWRRSTILVLSSWGQPQAVEAAGNGLVLKMADAPKSRRVLQLDIAAPAAGVKRVSDGVVERQAKAAKMANAVITADRGDCVSSVDPFGETRTRVRGQACASG